MISKIEKHILFKLHRNFYVKGLPKHVRGEAKKALKSLIKKGYILPKPTSYGLQVSLNPRMIGEIQRILA